MLNRLMIGCGVALALAAGCSEQRDLAPPTPSVSIASISPVSGPDTGGTSITIIGSGFVPGTAVTVGGAAVANLVLTNETLLVADTPGGTAGPVDVVVTNPSPSSATATNGFTFLNGPAPNPTITRVDPTSGPIAGGTTITLQGSGFQTGVTVTLGGTAGTNVTLLTGGRLTFTSPVGAAGAANIVVTNLDATTVTGTGLFTYGTPTPVITTVNVSTGPVAGGTAITITGTGFEAAGASQPTVVIGGAPATSVVAIDATTITCTTGAAGVVGPQNVVVTNPNTNSGTALGGYTYVGANPAPASLNPAVGPQAGGTTTTITGTDFYPGATVTVGGIAATVGTITPTSIVITTAIAAHPNGPANVVVTNLDTNSGTLTNGFSFQGPAPTITGGVVSPTNGPAQGGNTVTITGTNFRVSVVVTIGGSPATITGGTLPTSIEVTAPIGTAGLTSVVVTNTDLTTTSAPYTYNPPPTITNISPTNGTAGNGFTITGTNFLSGATVFFSTAQATPLTVLSGSITGSVPTLGSTGAITVTVTNPDGQTATVGFTYNPAPTVTNVLPLVGGPVAGGNAVTINGTGFLAGATVTFGSNAATVGTNTPTQLLMNAPNNGTPATVVVTVTNPDGQSATGSYTFNAAPAITTGINPTNGFGGNPFTITGTGFIAGAGVTFGASSVASPVVGGGGTTITGTVPAGPTGAVTVTVTNPDGQSTTTSFTYNPAPTINTAPIGLSPSNGGAAGTGTCTISGTGFISGCTVSWNGSNLTPTFGSSTSISVTIPAGTAPSSVAVFVTNPDTQTSNSVNYTYNLPPTLGSLAPSSGPETGGNTVTLNGSDFISGASVSWNGAFITTAFVSSSVLTVTAPALPPGGVTVFVQNPDGQTSGNQTYTYDPAQTHVLTGPTDFQVQERDGIDVGATPGSFQLALTNAGFASNGTRVTCLAYDANSTARIIVGTDSAGAFLSTNSGASWTAVNAHSSPSIPSNNVLCAEFFSPSSGPNTGGNVFIIGTDSGAALTHDGGASFRHYTTNSTPRVPGARVQGADFFDGNTAPTHFLLASNSETNLGGGAALWTTDGGHHFKEFNATSKPVALFGNYTTDVAYSPNSATKFLIASYSPDNPLLATASLQGGTGGVYLTSNGGTSFTRFSTVSSPATPSQGCTSVDFDPSDTVNGQIWAATFDGHAPKDTGSWSGGLWVTGDDGVTRTQYTSPTLASNHVRHVAYGGVAGEFVVATEAGLEVTTNNGGAFSRHTTGSVVRIPNDFVNGGDMVSGGTSSTGTIGVATGQKTLNSIGGGAAQSTDNLTSSVAVLTLSTPHLLPHPNVRDAKVFSGNSAGTHLLVATGTGAAISTDGGATWPIVFNAGNGLPSNDVRSVAWYDNGTTPQRCVIGTAAGVVVINNALSVTPTFKTITTGSTSPLVNDSVTAVDYFSGSAGVVDTVLVGTAGGLSYITSAMGTHTCNNFTATTWLYANAVQDVAFFHGQSTSAAFAAATTGGVTTTTNSGSTPTKLTGLPNSNTQSIDYWDGSGTPNTLLVGHAAGASISTASGGPASWTTFSVASTFGALPTNDVRAVAFLDAGATAATFALGCRSVITAAGPPAQVQTGGLVFTTNGLAGTPTFTRRTTTTEPRLPCNEVSSFDFDESVTAGTRWIAGCVALAALDTTGTQAPGGLVTENGAAFRAMGTLTVPQIEGGVMPRTSATAPTWDSRRIRGADFRRGSATHLVTGSLFGVAASVGGVPPVFAVANEATTPAFLSGVVLDTAIYGGDTAGNTWIAATPAGPYFTSNGGTSYTLRTGLPTNNVRAMEFHHGRAGLLAVATSSGVAISTNNGSSWTTVTPGGQSDCRDVDFWDGGTTNGSMRVAIATNNGVYVTTNFDPTNIGGATWTPRLNTDITTFPTPPTQAGNDIWAVRYDENDGTGATFWVGAWFSGSGTGGLASTSNHGTSFGATPTAIQFLFVWDIDVHNATSGHIVFGHQAGVTVTTNGGTGWTTHTFESTNGQLPASDTRRVSYGPAATGTWLAGTDDGLVITTDGGSTFGPFVKGTLSQYAYLAVNETTTGGTITYQFLDANGVLIPDTDLTGNSTGLTPTGGQIDLSGLSVATYPSIQVRVRLTSATGAATPSVQDLTLVYQY